MIRKFVLAASAVALVGGSVFAAVGSSAGAATTITAGTGSTLSCTALKAAVKISPALKDNWVKADHQDTTGPNAEPNSDVRAINNQTYAPPAPATVTGKGTSKTCGTSKAKQGATQVTLKSVSVTIASEAANPTTDPGTCLGLVNGALGVGDPSPARYLVTIKYVGAAGSPAKVAPTTITHAQIDNSKTTFTVHPSGTSSITGSYAFAGDDLVIAANADAKTIPAFVTEVGGPAPDGTTVARSTVNKGKSPGPCQPGIKIVGSPSVPSKPHSATPLAPKGIKAIGTSTLDSGSPGECGNSTLTINSPCTP